MATVAASSAEVRRWPADQVERWPLERIIPDARNSRTHSDAQIAQIAASMREWGWTNPLLVDEAGTLIAGHGRVLAARQLQLSEAPVMVARGWTEAQKRAYLIADNKLALNAGWDEDLLALELAGLASMDFDLSLLGFSDEEMRGLLDGLEEDLSGKGDADAESAGSLADRFVVPPFTVLNARGGWWQDRKRAWLALGIRSEIGRGNGAVPGGSKRVARYVDGVRETGLVTDSDTSVFDPVLCEIAYRWFSPSDGVVLDPFAGGSVRGIVAGRLGRRYVGVDLNAAQIAANREQATRILGPDDAMPEWIEGDSREIGSLCSGVRADLILTCPPYAELEKYSDDPRDLSNASSYAAFRKAYHAIIGSACERLKDDRFACVVVGEVRDKAGNYYDFVGDTVQAFRDAGLAYYNEAILVTAVGSLPLRTAAQFKASRKLGKTHQNVLVFLKGNAKRAVESCGPVEVDESMFEG
ncbi:ParB N-terminal domain-containing protein [Paraburkholderia sp. BR14320]|uniref:ParB N-terminal domain-containing protein n=1 Tax=unclassified Paraburkholderia TaxID=2615204 RepID=UPI0034CF646C